MCLVATSAKNTGIDAPKLIWVLRLGIPHCLITLLQERGRNALEVRTTGMFIVLADWIMFAYLVIHILTKPPRGDDEEIHDHFFVNLMIGAPMNMISLGLARTSFHVKTIDLFVLRNLTLNPHCPLLKSRINWS